MPNCVNPPDAKPTPLLSVVMPVYNGDRHIAEAIESILGQTYQHFEFIILDDGSTDSTNIILRDYAHKDPRIRVYAHPNQGIALSLNRGFELATGQYIVRMDADDISLPERFAIQVQYMEAHPNIGISGSWLQTIGLRNEPWAAPVDHEDIHLGMLFESCLFHPTVIIRRANVLQLGQYYDKSYEPADDWEYWVRLGALGVRFHNISKILLKYRIHPTKTGTVRGEVQLKHSDRIRERQLRRIGLEPSTEDMAHFNLLRIGQSSGPQTLQQISNLIDKILRLNAESQAFSSAGLSKELAKRWYKLCLNSKANGVGVWRAFNQNTLAKQSGLSLDKQLAFLIKSSLHRN